jgi:FKBP-type peptidyl-prolyl cis-trans isomerase SlyD
MAARIDPGTVVTLAYELRASDGEFLDEPGATVAYLHGGFGGIFPKVEAALEGQGPGHVVELSLEPEDAFGDYEPELLRVEPREAFPEVLQVGMRFEGVPGDAPAEELVVYTVTGIADEQVVVDGNHPLAGERVLFKCTVMEVRPATPEELRHGHAHGEHSPEGEEG